jgi:hypothetical protein
MGQNSSSSRPFFFDRTFFFYVIHLLNYLVKSVKGQMLPITFLRCIVTGWVGERRRSWLGAKREEVVQSSVAVRLVGCVLCGGGRATRATPPTTTTTPRTYVRMCFVVFPPSLFIFNSFGQQEKPQPEIVPLLRLRWGRGLPSNQVSLIWTFPSLFFLFRFNSMA